VSILSLSAENSSVDGINGSVSLAGNSDVFGGAPIRLDDFGSDSSLVSLTNTLGTSVIHVVGDVDPNGTYGTNTSSDMLFRSVQRAVRVPSSMLMSMGPIPAGVV
jgi:hypothetical protein